MRVRYPLRLAAVAAALSFAYGAHAQSSDTLQKIKETSSITLGYRESSVPFSYLDAQQKPIGMSIDVCQVIVAKVKEQLKLSQLEVKMVAVNSSNRVPLVANGTVDIECGGTANNLARQKEAGFSVTTFVGQPTWLVRNEANIKTVADLKGRAVVVTQGSNAVGFARKVSESDKLGLNITQAKDHAESQLTLETGRADAWLEDDIYLAGTKATSRIGDKLSLVPGKFDNVYYGLMFRKNDAAFKTLVDGTLISLMKSGDYDRLYKKWYESPIPPHNINLQFPMSAKLKERIKEPSDRIEE